ncbi:hypothetical protein [Empedobacter brevis]|uniref:crAss001_48 related protein n=1 Tax=Empedobacter brevis TaxID=247 RepID=UPI0028D471E4|nr:hypothetical protein [Empedobacter brevis]
MKTESQTLQPHQLRVVDEQLDLETKIVALEKFFETDTFKSLPDYEKELLMLQLEPMKDYNLILKSRIESFRLGEVFYFQEAKDYIGTFGIYDKKEVRSIKSSSILLINKIEKLGKDNRRKAIAKTELEKATMMAIKSLF